MLNYIKLFFQFLVVIQVLSVLLTGNTKIGTKLSLHLIKILQCSVSTMFYSLTYIIKLSFNIICKVNNCRKLSTEKLKNKQCQGKIRAYNNKTRNITDIQSYINHKQQTYKSKGLS